MIDAHVHFGGLPQGGKVWGDFEEYRNTARKIGLKSYCLTPIGKPENFSGKTTPDNDSVLKEIKKDKKIIPVYWFNVFDLPESIDERYKAIKFHPDIGPVDIDDSRVIEFTKIIGKPIFVHTNENKPYSSLLKVSQLARKVDVPVIAVHSGSVTKTFFNLDNYEFPDNVYFETSGIQYALILKKIHQRFGAKRIVFGSDYPFGDPRIPLAMIETLNLSKQDYALVTAGNIERLLGSL
jgi:predicted TIM-barrel fold metal-dependent hydrolase